MHPKFMVFSSYGAKDFDPQKGGYSERCHEPLFFANDLCAVEKELFRVWGIEDVKSVMVVNQHLPDGKSSGTFHCECLDECTEIVEREMKNNQPFVLISKEVKPNDSKQSK